MMVAHSGKSTGSIRVEPPGTRNAATTEDTQMEISWSRWPSVTDF